MTERVHDSDVEGRNTLGRPCKGGLKESKLRAMQDNEFEKCEDEVIEYGAVNIVCLAV